MAEFEERADQLPLDVIDETLADGPIFRQARQKLLAKGAKLLIGPRGTGKTHLMRYTYSHALRTATAPIAIYASFSQYLNLEPLLLRSPDALKRFHSWVVAKLILACFQALDDAKCSADILSVANELFNKEKLTELVALLERSSGDEEYASFGQHLTISHVITAIDILCGALGRDRAVLLLDDAALSLAQPYLVAFFEIFRLLKTSKISPKASVYPGSTQYGPTFHASHEAGEIELWLSVEDPQYSDIMGQIASKRLEEFNTINPDTQELLKYVAFGIPRAYLRLVREYLEVEGKTSQSKLNRIVERQTDLISAEYDSLSIKLRQFGSIISAGRTLFDRSVTAIRDAQSSEGPVTKSIVLGIKSDSTRNPLTERMLRFLVEVGMFYPLPAVSHGVNRKYDRYIPHFAFLSREGVFRTGRGSSSRSVTNYMARPPAKHPIRRELGTLLNADERALLKLDLPPCKNCGAARINDSQKFCHACGKELVKSSLFEECMQLPLEQVPGISAALIRRIHADTSMRTIGHVYASQNAAGELQQANYVGVVRAGDIVRKVSALINEFLS